MELILPMLRARSNAKTGCTSAHGGQAMQATSCDRDLPICNTPPAKFAGCASGQVLLSFLA